MLRLALPGGSILQLTAGTEIGTPMQSMYTDSGESELQIELVRGEVRVSCSVNPNSTTRLAIVSDEFTAKCLNGSGFIHKLSEEYSISWSTGTIEITPRHQRPLSLNGGQILRSGNQKVSIQRQMERPRWTQDTLARVIDDRTSSAYFGWQDVPSAVSYRVEVSEEVEFGWNVKHFDVAGTRVDIAQLNLPARWFLRVHPMDEKGNLGRPSQILSGSSPP